jgi:hypothetical protein
LIPGFDREAVGRSRPWDQISWWYSLILPVALVLLVITVLSGRFGDDPDFTGVVRNAYTGEPVKGAEVTANGTAVTTDDDGHFAFDVTVNGSLGVSRAEYESTSVPVVVGTEEVEIALRPTTLTGQVVNTRSNSPIAGATIIAEGPNSASSSTVTDEDGNYLLIDVPPEATVSVVYDGFSAASQPVGQSVTIDFAIRPDVVTGVVTDENGQPVPGATVQMGSAVATTGEDGTYRLGGIPAEGSIVVKKAGYREVVGEYPEELAFDATLERFIVKAIYVTGLSAANDEYWNELLDLVDSTELNAIVLDVKDNNGLVRYDTQVPLANEIGANDATYDLQEKLNDMHDRGIYAIARQVVFEDPVLAQARPDLAIKDSTTGSSWQTWDGLAWVNAMNQQVWQYNIDIAQEVANAGFDEVQLDYIRFPTDGPLENADYGTEFTEEARTGAITGFLTKVRDAIAPSGVYLAVDIFGITLWDEGDSMIGQDLVKIAPIVDIINPMIYPSHFQPGHFGFDYPNDHPYEVILWSLQRGQERIGDMAYKFRPWLQDFSYGPGIEYGTAEVQAQTQACIDFGSPGWMLWNAANVYHSDALAPQ